mgnify:CR=1 FL=1
MSRDLIAAEYLIGGQDLGGDVRDVPLQALELASSSQ